MKKDAYYFSHDSNAHKDPKVLRLRAKYGWEGYGIFWAIVETLREQENYGWSANDKDLLSFSFANGEPIVNEVIDYCIEIGLLVINNDLIQSESLNRRMELREKKRQRKVEAGRKGALTRWGNSDANSTADGTAIAKNGKGKKSKVKESKVKEKEKTLSEIKDLRNRYSSQIQDLIDKYWNVIRKTRKTGVISENIILRTMKDWTRYDPVVVHYSLKTHIESYDDGERNERYTLGIMRGTSKEEAEDRLNKVTSIKGRRNDSGKLQQYGGGHGTPKRKDSITGNQLGWIRPGRNSV